MTSPQRSDLVEPEGVNAASSDPEGNLSGEGQPAASHEAPQGAGHAEETAAPAGDLLGPPHQRDDSPGQELAAGEG